MNCEEIRKNLDLYIDSEILSDEERESIRAHLEECEACRREYEEMNKINEELKKLAEVELPKDFHKNLMKEIRKSNGKKEPFFKRHYRWSMAAAAVLLAGVVTTAGLGLLPGGNLMMGKSVPAEEAAMDYGAPEIYPAEEPTATRSGEMVTQTFTEEMDGEIVESGGGAVASASEDGTVERKIVKTVYLDLDTEAIEATFNQIVGHVEGLGGYVAYSDLGNVYYGWYEETNSQEQMRNGTINARIPAEQLDEFVDYVKTQGEIRTQSLNTSDLSDYYYDIEAQVANLKAREERLRELMDEAEDISDIIEVERELSRVRNEIDNLTRNLRYIDKDVDYSTVNIELREVMSKTRIATEDRDIWTEAKEGLIENVNRLIRFLQSALIWSISYLPIVIVSGVVLVVLYGVLRKLGIRRKK